MPTTRRRSSARCWRKATRRFRSRRTPSWCSTTPAASAIRPSKRSSTASTVQARGGQGQGFRRARVRGAAGRREDLRARAARQPGVRVGQLHALRRNAGAARSRQPPRHRAEPRYRRDLRYAVHAPRQSAPRLHHHHRRLRQIVRLLRGAVHARAGAQPHQRERDGRSAAAWRTGLHRNPAAGPERQQLSRSLARGLGFRHAAGARRPRFPASAACATPPRIRAISSRPSWTPWMRIRCSAITSTCRCNRDRRGCWRRCSGSTRATNTCGASSG